MELQKQFNTFQKYANRLKLKCVYVQFMFVAQLCDVIVSVILFLRLQMCCFCGFSPFLANMCVSVHNMTYNHVCGVKCKVLDSLLDFCLLFVHLQYDILTKTFLKITFNIYLNNLIFCGFWPKMSSHS